MQPRIIAFLLSLFVTTGLFASSKIDSLKSELDKNLNPEIKSNILNSLAWEYRDIRPDSSLYFTNSALKLSREKDLKFQEVQALNYMGVAYRNLGVYSRAFEQYLEAFRLADEYDLDEQKGYALINLGNLYLFQRNFEGAIRYFIQALDQAQSLGDLRMQAYCFINLGRSYEGTEEFGQSELYLQQAIEIRKNLEDDYGVIAAEIELADIYRKSGNNEKALQKVDEIIKLISEESNPRVLLLAFNTLSQIYLEQGKIELAQKYAFEALRLAKSVSSRYDERNVLEQLSRINLKTKDYKETYEYYFKYAELNQQLFSEENIRKIEQLKNQYEFERKESENQFLREQAELKTESINRLRTINTLAIVLITLLGIVVIIAIRAYLLRKKLSEKIKLQRDEIEKDKSTIESQSEKLKELDAAKSRFFANVSHDLRSPLSLIIGNLEMVSEDEENIISPRSKKHLDISFKNSKRLLYLTDEINDITKLEEGKINLKKEKIKINSFVRLLTDMFIETANQKGVKLNFSSLIQDYAVVNIDGRQFEKILYNLISNALKFTSDGDEITISLKSKNDKLLLEVCDSGEGIDKDSLPYIFDRFYQSKGTDYRAKEGLGIGLALVKDLVNLHGGNIKAKSKKGEYTKFLIELPEFEESSFNVTNLNTTDFISEQTRLFKHLETTSSNVVIPKTKSLDHSVLIVDDHPEIRYYIRQILEDHYHVYEASHGIEAIDLLDEHKIDLIITDLMMPWMDGFEFIEAINSNNNYKQIPVLVVSARVSGEDKEKVLDSGINDYLQKPFSKKELNLRVDNLLSQKKKYAEENQNVFSNLVKNNFVEVEKTLLNKLQKEVEDRISDPNLSVLVLADALAASERQVYRLVKKLTGFTPNEYIKEVRLQYADYLIRKNKVRNASEAAKSIGLKNVTQFSKQYEKKFGQKPVDLLES